MKSFTLVLFLSLVSADAFAYKLYKTGSGKNILWTREVVEIILDDSLKGLGSKAEIEAEVAKCFAVWEDGAGLPVTFDLIWDTCNEVKDDGNNCIFACENKSDCYARPEEKGGTTYLNISPSTGAITDADIVLNADDWEWDVNGNLSEGLAFDRVLVHEIGHLLGIDHTDVEEAIMYPTLSISNKEEPVLHDDDVDAAETLYANFEDFEPTEVSACSVSNVGATNSGAGLFGLLMTLLTYIRIRSPRH